MKRSGVLIVVAVATLALAGAATAALDTPESVVFHKGKIYVSQIGRFGVNDGSLVRVDRRGNVLQTIVRGDAGTDLVDPKGLAVVRNKLCVTDVTVIRCFNRTTGAQTRLVSPPGAQFLNDLTNRGATMYASDTMADVIYRVAKNGAVRQINLPARFSAPNGVAVHPKTKELWFVTAPGQAGQAEIARRTARGKIRLVKASSAFTSLDGLAFKNATAYVTDFQTGELWRLSPRGKLKRRTTLTGSPADLTFAAPLNRLLIPRLNGDDLVVRKP